MTFRLRSWELDAAKHAAAHVGVTLSEFIRAAVLQESERRLRRVEPISARAATDREAATA